MKPPKPTPYEIAAEYTVDATGLLQDLRAARYLIVDQDLPVPNFKPTARALALEAIGRMKLRVALARHHGKVPVNEHCRKCGLRSTAVDRGIARRGATWGDER